MKILQSLLNLVSEPNKSTLADDDKYGHEVEFWKRTIDRYIAWYRGEREELYLEKPPKSRQKIKAKTEKLAAILTWEKIHQHTKYLQDLELKPDAFKGKKLLDVGSGPHFSALTYQGAEIFNMDPLWSEYLKLGFPTYHSDRVRIVKSFAENMPFEDNFMDAVISVNALDHVDDFEAAAMEIGRVLKPKGKVRFHLHYHEPTKTEPVVLNDDRIRKAFCWCKGFIKISESKEKRGYKLENPKEKFVLWSNFK